MKFNKDSAPMFRPTRLTFTKDKITSNKINGNRCSVWGIAHLLLYYQILKDIEDGELSPNQEVLFSAEAAREYGALRSTKGHVGEKRLLKDVLNQAISLNAPDCIVALFEVYGGWENTQRKLNELGRLLSLSRHSRIVPTGRKNDIQLTNIYDYYKIGVAFLELKKTTQFYMKNRNHIIRHTLYTPQGLLGEKENIFSSIFWGTDQNDCLIFIENGDQFECSLVINGKNVEATSQLAIRPDSESNNTELLQLKMGDSLTYKDWLMQGFDGYFLNERIIDEIEISHVSMDESYILRSSWDKVAFISLSAANVRSLIPGSRKTIHVNEQIEQSKLLDRISLIVTNEPILELKNKIPQYIVPDSLRFAYQYASYISEIYSGKFITITGSAGKSSTRLMLSHLLKDSGKIFENYGNANLHYPTFGLSLEINDAYDFILFEAAGASMNLFSYGNNAYIWQSNVAIITSIGTAHAVDGIERNVFVKKQIFFGVKEGGYAVINGDIPKEYLSPILKMAKELNLTILMYSLKEKDVDCFVTKKEVMRDRTDVSVSLMNKELHFSLKTDSDGQIQNAMAVLLAVECIGYSAEEFTDKLLEFKSFERILNPTKLQLEGKEMTLVDDTHNSSIEAAINGINYFASKKKFYKGKSILVLGETADLGNQTVEQHKRLEPAINAALADKVIIYGEPFKHLKLDGDNVVQCDTKEQIIQEICEEVTNDSFAFVKGSHGIGFYEVVNMLKEKANFVENQF
ncbi:hypothetical protein JZO77_17270 [Enterococcus hulanensis]|uniref:Mur ligase family protein n=1 Tax=Enterococcus hulanensis TaxID=2559929 RepID=UPI001A906843|nr:Mur ligase family protein [Enterococcus hulanensis]MBO0458487.1 hypothetical protein [Enterococcus hulanensis]